MGIYDQGQTTPLFNVPLTAPEPINVLSSPNASPAPINGPSVMAATSQPTKFQENDPKHKGAAGVARDILGTLGDFLLTRLHMPAMYGPAQHQRRLDEAMSGFQTDPIGAINQVTAVDYNAGSKLRDQFIDNQRLAAQQASTQEAREARVSLLKQATDDRTRNRVAAMLDSMDGWSPDKRSANYGIMRDQALAYAKRNGLDLSTELPETYSPDLLDSFIDQSMPVGMQRAQRLSSDNNVRNNETSTANNIRSTTTSRDNNIRTTDTSRDNNVRSTNTSRDNNVRNNDTSRRNQDVRAATADKRIAAGPTRWPQPTAADIQAIRSRPDAVAGYDAKFGPGAHKKVLK